MLAFASRASQEACPVLALSNAQRVPRDATTVWACSVLFATLGNGAIRLQRAVWTVLQAHTRPLALANASPAQRANTAWQWPVRAVTATVGSGATLVLGTAALVLQGHPLGRLIARARTAHLGRGVAKVRRVARLAFQARAAWRGLIIAPRAMRVRTRPPLTWSASSVRLVAGHRKCQRHVTIVLVAVSGKLEPEAAGCAQQAL